jgi:hypothetical protein
MEKVFRVIHLHPEGVPTVIVSLKGTVADPSLPAVMNG